MPGLSLIARVYSCRAELNCPEAKKEFACSFSAMAWRYEDDPCADPDAEALLDGADDDDDVDDDDDEDENPEAAAAPDGDFAPVQVEQCASTSDSSPLHPQRKPSSGHRTTIFWYSLWASGLASLRGRT